MHKKVWTLPLLGCLFFLSGLVATHASEEVVIAALPPAAKTQVDFNRDIAPIFRERCFTCHGPDKQMGGLRLDLREQSLVGGYSGAVIKPGNSAESKLIHMVAGLKEGLIMPLGGERLTPEQVGLLRAWIDQGAEWGEKTKATREVSKSKKRQSTHWAFIPPEKAPLPRVRNRDWGKNPIDAFVLAKLEAEGVEPSPEADRPKLIRRVSLDLIGLPPTPEELDRFLNDDQPGAYQRLVDRLLASPHYGEKWALQWLDLARFGESDGYQTDFVRSHAWRWRHWVIDAFNRNMPFDQFTIEQIAGDLLPRATVEQKVATGFHRNTLTNRETGFPLEMDRVEQVVDRTNTFGTVWLALGVGCARCHDHKFDPITQKEYYQFYAFFNTAVEVNLDAPLAGEMQSYLQRKTEYDRKWRKLMAEHKVAEQQAGWEKRMLEVSANPTNPEITLERKIQFEHLQFEIDGIGQSRFMGGEEILITPPSHRPPKHAERLTRYFIFRPSGVSEQQRKQLKWEELSKKLAELDAAYPALSEAQTLTENPNPPQTHILIRGGFRDPGIEVQPNTPAFLPSLPPHNGGASRLSLGRWVVSRDNPLTARVAVNRMWQEFFGQGLIKTSEDFGARGDPPTHPKLLDWLAVEFMESGWNVKKMQKLIVSSATYRQSSKTRKDLKFGDPYNKLLARQSRFRLSAELVRDVTLATSGLLNPAIGGKSIRPSLPPGVTEIGFGDYIKWPESQGRDRYRRGVYIFRQRALLYPQLVTFDAPNTLTSRCRREQSTTPLQALTLLNDPVFFEAAQALAERILRENHGRVSDRIDYAFKLCLARKPKPGERERLLEYYRQQKEMLARNPESIEALQPSKTWEGIDPSEAAVWVGVSSVLLNLEEFITRG